jgi:hypothetical protein
MPVTGMDTHASEGTVGCRSTFFALRFPVDTSAVERSLMTQSPPQAAAIIEMIFPTPTDHCLKLLADHAPQLKLGQQ